MSSSRKYQKGGTVLDRCMNIKFRPRIARKVYNSLARLGQARESARNRVLRCDFP
jgi:hypothetical protein